MAVEMAWVTPEDDVVTSRDLGVIKPGESYHEKTGAYLHFLAKNVGDTPAAMAAVTIEQIGDYESHQRTTIATGESEPGDFQGVSNGPLQLGPIPAGGTVNVWANVAVELTDEALQGKALNLRVTGVA
jgi:hypothetical protein